MSKKLTKAEIAKIKRLAKIAKNPTAAINSGKMKMKKQEVPLAGIGKAAARLVGKAIVNATTGKTAARKYAESSMRADAKRAAARKSAKSVKEALKTAKKSKPLAEPKSAVRVKPAAKQRPNKPDEAKAFSKANDSAGRAYNRALREYNSMPEAGRFGSAAEAQANARDAALAAGVSRKTSIAIKKLTEAEKRKATTPKRTPSNPARTTVKINSAKSVRVRKVSPKKSK